MYYLIC